MTVYEFSDFGCPFCGMFARGTYPELHEEFVETGKVRWTYVPFVMGMFPNGAESARAAECAGGAGALLGDARPALREAERVEGEPRPGALFRGYAAELGLDEARFASCYREDRGGERTRAQQPGGRRAAVRATPSFFVNGRLVEGALPAEQFRAMLTQLSACRPWARIRDEDATHTSRAGPGWRRAGAVLACLLAVLLAQPPSAPRRRRRRRRPGRRPGSARPNGGGQTAGARLAGGAPALRLEGERGLVRPDRHRDGEAALRGGQSWEFSTPPGEFRVQLREEEPVWLLPDWDFVERGEPIPPPDSPRAAARDSWETRLSTSPPRSPSTARTVRTCWAARSRTAASAFRTRTSAGSTASWRSARR